MSGVASDALRAFRDVQPQHPSEHESTTASAVALREGLIMPASLYAALPPRNSDVVRRGTFRLARIENECRHGPPRVLRSESDRTLGYAPTHMPKKQKRLTRKERQERDGKGPAGAPTKHIHCMACGRHIDPPELTQDPPTATYVSCQHGSKFASCVRCLPETRARLAEHDATGREPRIEPVWH